MILISSVKMITFRLLEEQLPCLKSNSDQAVAIALHTGEGFLKLQKHCKYLTWESGWLDTFGEDCWDDEDKSLDVNCEDDCRESDDGFCRYRSLWPEQKTKNIQKKKGNMHCSDLFWFPLATRDSLERLITLLVGNLWTCFKCLLSYCEPLWHPVRGQGRHTRCLHCIAKGNKNQ